MHIIISCSNKDTICFFYFRICKFFRHVNLSNYMVGSFNIPTVLICNYLEHNFFLNWCEDLQLSQSLYTPIENPDCIGEKIDQRIRQLKMTQMEFSTAIGIARSDVNRILRKTSFDTDRLAMISRTLGKNFFYEYCLNENQNQVNKNTSDGDSLLIKRYENLVIENSRLKQELNDARKEIAKLRYTI